ncbi:kinase-like protein [Macrolepiota fuliginosa MF-IS2]|uniref:Kinase-like protein n=1 Tax=Macrolepiota fuliginosa MF-IS2 TaxID=1400762 RepID=A0A9P5WY09_9AGAR|nr:kinase-like protein [Macrolepiota fuliginosa MF-IS2]
MQVLLLPSLPTPWLRKHSRIALYRLCSASMLCPQCYALEGIVKPNSAEASGGFGDIFKGRHGDRTLCLKVIRLHQRSDVVPALKVCVKEGMMWAELRHTNILPFYGVYYLDEKREQFCLVSPWMDRGDVVTYLRNNPSIPRTPFIYDIASGMKYLHSEGMVHGDIKGANVLVNDSGRACITDFGLASIQVDQTLSYSRGATTVSGCSYRWAAPELLEDGAHMTKKSDVWAFGCVCYEIYAEMVPFYECTLDTQIMRKLMIGILPIGSVQPSQIDNSMWELMVHCCTSDPTGRPEFWEILEGMKGPSNTVPSEVPIETLPEGQQFLNKIREGKRTWFDLDGVRCIFNKVRARRRLL